MSDVTDYEITDAMISYGGGFVNALGHLYRRADEINKAKLRMAFPEYWEQYREMVTLRMERAK